MLDINIITQKALKFFEEKVWIEWFHISKGAIHCPVCLSLNKCWFVKTNMPILPQHSKCHCIIKPISSPISGKTISAFCNLGKFADYIFSDKYTWNGKRVLFENSGFNLDDSELLKSIFEKQAEEKYASGEYSLGKLDAMGQRISIEIVLEKEGHKKMKFLSGWMVRPLGYITNNTPFGGLQ